MRAVKFDPEAFKEFVEWSKNNKAVFNKINELIIASCRDPFDGIGKPELLKRNYRGYWSRRITDEHRLVYKADDSTIYVVKCFGHYD